MKRYHFGKWLRKKERSTSNNGSETSSIDSMCDLFSSWVPWKTRNTFLAEWPHIAYQSLSLPCVTKAVTEIYCNCSSACCNWRDATIYLDDMETHQTFFYLFLLYHIYWNNSRKVNILSLSIKVIILSVDIQFLLSKNNLIPFMYLFKLFSLISNYGKIFSFSV